MQALIFSDSHGNIKSMTDIIDKYSEIDFIIHAGDVLSDVYTLKELYPEKTIAYVKGNNDYFDKKERDTATFTFSGKKIFLAHGHAFGVKFSPYKFYAKARELGADIGIFGHTHSRFYDCIDGIHIFNPGASTSSCGLLTINDNEINLEFLYE